MGKPGKTFFTANSKNGRKIASASAPLRLFHIGDVPKEVADWNRAVQLKKDLKAQKRLVAKEGKAALHDAPK